MGVVPGIKAAVAQPLEGFTWKRDALGSETALQPYTAKQYTFCFMLAM